MLENKSGDPVAASAVPQPEPDTERVAVQLLRVSLAEAIEQITQARREVESERAVLCMAVARLGGIVEGRPTGRHNFLQRIDALRVIEADHGSAPQDQHAVRAAFLEGFDMADERGGSPDEVSGLESWGVSEARRRSLAAPLVAQGAWEPIEPAILSNSQKREILEIANKFHRAIEGEYGCPSDTCPGVQRLVQYFTAAIGIGKYDYSAASVVAQAKKEQDRRERQLLIQGRIWQIDAELQGGAPTREELKRELEELTKLLPPAPPRERKEPT